MSEVDAVACFLESSLTLSSSPPAPAPAPAPVPAPTPGGALSAPSIPAPADPVNANTNASDTATLVALLADPALLSEKMRCAEQTLRMRAAHVGELERAGRMTDAAELKNIVRLQITKLRQFQMQLAQAQSEQAQAGSQVAAKTEQPPPGWSNATDLAAKLEPGAGPGRPTPALPPAVLPGSQGAGPGRWQGTFSWRGFDSETHMLKDLQTQVFMEHMKGEILRAEQWPNSLTLAPSQHSAVAMPVLFQWLQRQQCLFLPIQPHPQAPDPKTNEEHFRALNRLLTEKNVYALASWPPNKPENRLLIFPHNGLCGAYFPNPGGMPELPKGPDMSSNPNPATNQNPNSGPGPGLGMTLQLQQQMIVGLLQSMAPEQQAAFRSLPADQKAVLMKRLIAAKMAQIREQQQQELQQQQTQAQQMTHANQQPQTMDSWAPEGPSMEALLSQFAAVNLAGGAVEPQSTAAAGYVGRAELDEYERDGCAGQHAGVYGQQRWAT